MKPSKTNVPFASSWFQRHPRRALAVVYVLIGTFFLGADFVISNIRKSTPDLFLYESQPPIGHVHRAGLSGYYGVRFWNEFKAPFVFNNLGFRDRRPFDPSVTDGKHVVFALGDSTTACLEVPAEKSYPAVLEQHLGTNFVVFNAGVRAYDTQQVLLLYRERLRALNPAFVVYLICLNDYYDNVDLNEASPYVIAFGKGIFDEHGQVRFVPPSGSGMTPSGRFLRWAKFNLNFHTTLAVRTGEKIAGILRPAQQPPEASAEGKYSNARAVTKMHALLTEFDRLTKQDGVGLYLAFLPEFYLDTTTLRQRDFYRAYQATREFVEANLQHAVLIPSIDHYIESNPEDSSRPAFTFARDAHANEYGCAWLGQAIAGFIQADLERKASQRVSP